MNDFMLFEAMEKNGNLHICLNGQFTSKTAQELALFMSKSYRGEGNIIINAKKVTDVTVRSTDVFDDSIGNTGLPRQKIYLVGSKGLEICQLVHRGFERKKKREAQDTINLD